VPEYVGDGDDDAHDLPAAEKDKLEAALRIEIAAHMAAKEQRQASQKRRRRNQVSVRKSKRAHQSRD